jgi:macrolide-specific efflux system membrane fusion protein
MKLLSKLLSFLFTKKGLGAIAIVLVGFVVYTTFFASSSKTPQYQTATVQKGTLVVSLSESGQVSSANNTPISTSLGGVVKTLYVKNGDTVQQGDKIADLELDQASQAKQQSALASYQQAKTSLANAQAQLYSLQSSMYSNWQTYMDTAQNTTNSNGDGSPNVDNRSQTQFTVPQDNWQAAEAQYKNQQAVIAQAQTSLSSAWLTYQQSSSTSVAPISGTITGLSVQEGSVIATTSNNSSSSTSTSSTTSSSNKIASVKTGGNPLISVSLSEVDVPKIKPGQKATVTFDAFPDKTFTGHVFSVDTTGSVSSGVTTYPAVIQLDDANDDILANMSATANIITKTDDDVLLVPSSAVHTTNGSSTVQVLQNGQITTVDVTIGDASDSQTEILSGLSENATIVTSSTTAGTTGTTTSGSSPFSSTRGFGGGFGGGGAVRVSR